MALPHVISTIEIAQSFLAGAVLNQVESGAWRILTEEGEFIEAKLAASCLVEPTKTSEVLLAAHRDQYYILAVLTRPSKDLNLEAQNILISSENLKIQNKVTEMTAENLHAVEAKVMTQKADKILLN